MRTITAAVLLHPAATSDRPDGGDDSVTDAEERFVEMHRLVGVIDLQFDAVADARPFPRSVECHDAVLGREPDRLHALDAAGNRSLLAGIDRATTGVDDDAILGRAAGNRRQQGQRWLDRRLQSAVETVAHRGASSLNLGDTRLRRGMEVGAAPAAGDNV